MLTYFAVVLLSVVSASASAISQAKAETKTPPEVRYVANSGMLVTVSGLRFLIDAPIRDGIPPYATSSAEEREALENARAPYNNVDVILITHWHEDHFSAEAVATFLSNSSRTILISSPEVTDRVRKVLPPAVDPLRLHAQLPPPGNVREVNLMGVPLRVLRLRHNPTRRLPEQHVGFLIGDSNAVLHIGDADPAADNFALLKALPPVDLAFLPFWYVSDDANRRLVAESIRPRRIVAMHVPPADAAKVAPTLLSAAEGVSIVLAAKPGTPLTP
jgi:L-ascorbate metabolism protein UlaG (beta-lactamase superfamily)